MDFLADHLREFASIDHLEVAWRRDTDGESPGRRFSSEKVMILALSAPGLPRRTCNSATRRQAPGRAVSRPRRSSAFSTSATSGPISLAHDSRAKAAPNHLGWDVTALYQEAEPHDVARQSRGDDARANVVADIAAPTDERLLLSDAHPLAGDFIEPDVLRKNRQSAGAERQVRRRRRDRLSPPSPLRAPAWEDRATSVNPALHRLERPTIPAPKTAECASRPAKRRADDLQHPRQAHSRPRA